MRIKYAIIGKLKYRNRDPGKIYRANLDKRKSKKKLTTFCLWGMRKEQNEPAWSLDFSI